MPRLLLGITVLRIHRKPEKPGRYLVQTPIRGTKRLCEFGARRVSGLNIRAQPIGTLPNGE